MNRKTSQVADGGPVNFVLAGTQRSGTTLVQQTLDSHPQIFCGDELFSMRRIFRNVPKRSCPEPGYHWWLNGRLDRWLLHGLARDRAVRRYLDWLLASYSSDAT